MDQAINCARCGKIIAPCYSTRIYPCTECEKTLIEEVTRKAWNIGYERGFKDGDNSKK